MKVAYFSQEQRIQYMSAVNYSHLSKSCVTRLTKTWLDDKVVHCCRSSTMEHAISVSASGQRLYSFKRLLELSVGGIYSSISASTPRRCGGSLFIVHN